MWQSAASGGARCIGGGSPAADGPGVSARLRLGLPAATASMAAAWSSARRFIFMVPLPGAFLGDATRRTACTPWPARSTMDFAGVLLKMSVPPSSERGRPYPPPRRRAGRRPGGGAVPRLARDLVFLATSAEGAGGGGLPRAGAGYAGIWQERPAGAGRGLYPAPHRRRHGGAARRARDRAGGHHWP